MDFCRMTFDERKTYLDSIRIKKESEIPLTCEEIDFLYFFACAPIAGVSVSGKLSFVPKESGGRTIEIKIVSPWDEKTLADISPKCFKRVTVVITDADNQQPLQGEDGTPLELSFNEGEVFEEENT